MFPKRIGFIPINALLMLVTILHFARFQTNLFVYDLILIGVLILTGTFIYLGTLAVDSTKWFIFLMYTTAWILLLLNGPSYLYYGIGRILMSFVPNMLFIFFAHFTNLPRKSLYHKCNMMLLISGLVTLVSLLSFIPFLSYVLFVHVLFSMYCCVWLSIHYKHRQRKILSVDRRIMNMSIAVSFIPCIAAYTIFGGLMPSQAKFYTIYASVFLPLGVGYLLLKRNGIQTRFDYRLTLNLLALFIGGAVLFIGFVMYVMGLSFVQSLLLLLMVYILLYVHVSLQKLLSLRQVQVMSRAKEELEKERLEILQNVTYDRYITALNGMIRQFIDRTIPLNGMLTIWKEQESSYILEQNGIFEECSLKKINVHKLKNVVDTISIEGEIYYVFPLVYQKKVNGWMITGHKVNSDKFTTQEVETLMLLADMICEILKTTEILYENQRRYVQLPNLTYEDYQNIRISQKTEDIRKEVALYLHDDILQSISAVHNMIEVLETPRQKELHDFINETLEGIIRSIRNKMFDIYPTTLKDLGLYQSLTILCNRLMEEAVMQPNLKIRVESEMELEVDDSLQFTVFRTIKELVQNAIKHAQAKEIVVSLELSEDHILVVDVMDDGVGIDVESDLVRKTAVPHIGLLTVKQEIDSLHGELSIMRNATNGTHVQFKLPMEGANMNHVYHTI